VTLLAQQELVEPAPVRRLIVPQQCGSWWGVDPSTVPGLVMVEQPSGKMENPNLLYAVGVILAATWAGRVHDVFDGAADRDVHLELVEEAGVRPREHLQAEEARGGVRGGDVGAGERLHGLVVG
jgi:hypothetical protein